MKTKLAVAILLAGSSLFAETRFSIGVGVGQGYRAPQTFAYRAPSPAPGFVWVDGYWDYSGHRRFWHNGSWVRQSFGRQFASPQRYDRERNDRDRFNGNRDRFDNSYGRR